MFGFAAKDRQNERCVYGANSLINPREVLWILFYIDYDNDLFNLYHKMKSQ